ncbi:MAG: Ig-like domain-containing protein, partial [Mycobacterium sp.]
MKALRTWLGVLCAPVLAAGLAACGDGGVKSPDFEAQLLSISVTPTSATVQASSTEQLTAKGTYTTQPGSSSPTEVITLNDASWLSTDPAVASVSSTGLVTGGTKAGTTTITASKKGVTSNTVTITGQGAILTGVVVVPDERIISPSETQAFEALGVYAGSTTPQPLNVAIAWTSSNPAAATLNVNQGSKVVATGVAVGQTTISATAGGFTGTALLTVANATLQSLAVNPVTASTPLGQPVQFDAIGTFKFEGSGDTFTQTVAATWVSSAPTVATVAESSGLATPVSLGKTTLTATFQGQTATGELTVTAPVLTQLLVEPATASIPAGATQAFTAKGVYSDTGGEAIDLRDGTTVSWTSGSTSIATVAPATGTTTTPTGKTVGNTTITATSGTLTANAALTVTAAELQSLLRIEPPTAVVAKGRTVEFQAIGKYTDGSEVPVQDSSLTWSSSAVAAATVDANGIATGVDPGTATISAKLNSNGSTVSGTLIVTSEVCTAPLLKADKATADSSVSGLCVLCGVSNPDNVIDADVLNYA